MRVMKECCFGERQRRRKGRSKHTRLAMPSRRLQSVNSSACAWGHWSGQFLNRNRSCPYFRRRYIAGSRVRLLWLAGMNTCPGHRLTSRVGFASLMRVQATIQTPRGRILRRKKPWQRIGDGCISFNRKLYTCTGDEFKNESEEVWNQCLFELFCTQYARSHSVLGDRSQIDRVVGLGRRR